MQYTSYREVDALFVQLLDTVPSILGEAFIGMYLYGSLAVGGFDPAMSDVDFLVAVKDEVAPEQLDDLRRMHGAIFTGGKPLATELEGSYLPLRALRRYDPADIMHPHIDRGVGHLNVERHDTDWVIRYWMVRERGIVLAGPPPETLVDPISPSELKQAIVDMMWWWRQQLEDTHLVEEDGYQWYAVQTMCRIRYTMVTREIVSKPTASRWAVEHLVPRWQPLIERAMAWRPPARMDRLEETLAFVRETVRFVETTATDARRING